MKKQILLGRVLPLLLIGVLSGCKPFLVKDLAGEYQGILTIRSTGNIQQSTVKAKVEVPGKITSLNSLLFKNAKISVTEENGTQVEIKFSRTGLQSATVESNLFNQKLVLKHHQEHCFLSYENANETNQDTAQICFEKNKKDANVLALDFSFAGGTQKISLILSTKDTFSLPIDETPQAYALSALIDRTKNMSFDSRIEVEKLNQARLQAENAEMNLLPHISINFGIGLIGSTFNPLSLIKSVGTLVPFLFPTEWFRVSEKEDLAKAEAQTQLIVRANTVNTIEGLSYNYFRDKALMAAIQAQKSQISQFKDEVEMRESAGIMPAGSKWKMKDLLDQIEGADLAMQRALVSDLGAISLASGFVSPRAITDVTLDVELDSAIQEKAQEIAESADESTFEKSVLLRSPELTQMEFLVKAAQMQKNERIWNWLDPSGDSAGAIGGGLPSFIKIGSASLRAAQDQKEQLFAILKGKAQDSFNEVEFGFKSLSLVSDSLEQQRKVLDLMKLRFSVGDAIAILDLVTALQSRFQAESTFINARYGILTSLAKRERLLMMGKYGDTPTRKQ